MVARISKVLYPTQQFQCRKAQYAEVQGDVQNQMNDYQKLEWIGIMSYEYGQMTNET